MEEVKKTTKAKQEKVVFEEGKEYTIIANGNANLMPKGNEYTVTAELAEILVNVKKVADLK